MIWLAKKTKRDSAQDGLKKSHKAAFQFSESRLS